MTEPRNESLRQRMDLLSGSLHEWSDSVHDRVADKVAEVKPKLRGWLHLATAPAVFAAGIVLIALAPSGAPRVGAIVFTVSALLLFSVSALFHRGRWSPRMLTWLRRWDHANIFLLIAGSYTPFSLMLLDGVAQTVMLSVAWGGAILGMLFRIFWTEAPRWLYVPIYIALGWAAVFFIPAFFEGAVALGVGLGIAVFVLICVGGALYTVGGVVYGVKRPNPWPRWFGFHEVFHSFTVLAFIAHYVSVSMATYSLR
ncbi:PAQR family membrane homeostasis protein TrhA [Nocardioides insulae]|uniref:PAQR family membrane homeostasis protein TrhA n=1 Tax=Nocardioides insulae TaxID=394734 RepID=UPI00048E1393|nr:hemolysin III family protein [Nocardioides insulae]